MPKFITITAISPKEDAPATTMHINVDHIEAVYDDKAHSSGENPTFIVSRSGNIFRTAEVAETLLGYIGS